MRYSVKAERTGWRDGTLSERHRLYGWDCPAVDIDFLLVEFDQLLPAAIVEYKAGLNRKPDFTAAGIRTLRTLASLAQLPAWLAFYDSQSWTFKVYPLNTKAERLFEYGEVLPEVVYVQRLYLCRGRRLPAKIAVQLNGGSL